MLKNKLWIKKIQSARYKRMYFNVTEYEKFVDMVSDYTLLLTKHLRKYHLLRSVTVPKHPELFEKATKILFPFPSTYLCDSGCFLVYFNQDCITTN